MTTGHWRAYQAPGSADTSRGGQVVRDSECGTGHCRRRIRVPITARPLPAPWAHRSLLASAHYQILNLPEGCSRAVAPASAEYPEGAGATLLLVNQPRH